MAYPKLIASAWLVAALSLLPSASALAQHRGSARVAPRGSVRVYRPSVVSPRYYGYR